MITANILLVVVESYVVVYAGLIFLAFGAMEWSRDMSIGYYKTILAYGIKLMTTLLLAGIGLSILLGYSSSSWPGLGERYNEFRGSLNHQCDPPWHNWQGTRRRCGHHWRFN